MSGKVFRLQTYYIASVIFFIIGIVYFIACIHQPFIGLEIENINEQWLVISCNPYGEGAQSGIQVGDQILKINDQDAGKYRLLQKWGEVERASTIVYRRIGQVSDNYIIINIRERPDLLTVLSESPMVILGFLFWFLGFMTWIKRPFLLQARTLFWLNWLIGLTIVLAQASSRDLLFARELECLTFSLVPVFLISFFSIFPISNKNRINSIGYKITIVIFLLVFVLFLLQSFDLVHFDSLLRKLMLSNMLIGIIFVICNLALSVRLTKDKSARNQAGIILLGMTVGFMPIMLLTAVPTILNHPQLVNAQVSSLFICCIPVSLYYVIVNKYLTDSHQLFRTVISQFIIGIIFSLILTCILYTLQIMRTPNIETYLALLFLTMLLIVCNNLGCLVINKLFDKFGVLKDSWGYKPRIVELSET